MFKRMLFVMLACSVAACGSGSRTNSDAVADPGVCSRFSVQNATSYELTLLYEPHAPTNYPLVIAPGETKEIKTTCEIGVDVNYALTPSEVFSTFAVHAAISGADQTVYENATDSDWQLSIVNDTAEYLLILIDQDLVQLKTQTAQ